MVNALTESLVLMHVFAEPDGYPRAMIESELGDLGPVWITESIESLQAVGVIAVDGDRVYPSQRLARLAELHIISF